MSGLVVCALAAQSCASATSTGGSHRAALSTDAQGRPTISSLPLRASAGESLGLQLYVVRSEARSLDAVKAHLAEHRAYLRQLEDRDVLFAAGPLWTSDGDGFQGDGLIIVRASSPSEASEIALRDPLHRLGARSFTVTPWMLNDGALTVRIALSRQLRELK